MTVYCAYAMPNSVNQIHLHESNKKRANFKNLTYLKAGTNNQNRTTDKFQGVWYTKSGMGDFGDGRYAYVDLNKKGTGTDELCADIVVKDFGFDIPEDAVIHRFGVVFSGKCENSKMKVNAPVIRVTSLPAKDLHKIYADKDVNLYTNTDYNALENGLVGSKEVSSKKRNIAFTYDVKSYTNTLKPSELNKSSFKVQLEFGANEGTANGKLMIDGVGVYVEYETPEYSLVNTDKYDSTDSLTKKKHRTAYINEETIHHINLKNTNNVVADEIVTKLSIPKCMTVVGADVSNGNFAMYRTGRYSLTYIPKFINPSETVMRGSYFQVQLVDTTNNNTPIPFVNVTFKYQGRIHTVKTTASGLACLPIRSGAGTHDIAYSFSSEFYEPCMGSKRFVVKSNRTLNIDVPEPTLEYKDRWFTAIAKVKEQITKDTFEWHNVSNATLTAHFKNKTTGKDYWKECTANTMGRAVFKLDMPSGIYDVTVHFERSKNDDLCKDEYDIFDKATTPEYTITYNPNPKPRVRVSCVNSQTEEDRGKTVHRFPRHGVVGLKVTDGWDSPLDSEKMQITTSMVIDDKETPEKVQETYTDRNGVAWFKLDYSDKYPVKVVIIVANVTMRDEDKVVYVRSIEPHSDDKFNYRWVTRNPKNETLAIHLLPKTVGECDIDVYNNRTGVNAPYYYNNKLFYGNDDINILTNELQYNKKEYIEFTLNFNPKDYNDETLGVEGDVFSFNYEDFTDTVFDWDNLEIVDDSSPNVQGEGCVTVLEDKVTMYVKPSDGGVYFLHCKLPVRTKAEITDIVTGEPTYTFGIDIVGHTGGAYEKELWIIEKLPYRITGGRANILFDRSSPQANQGDWGEYLLNCTGDPQNYFDVKEDMNFWVHKPKIFIGMVELHRSHSSPTAEDTQTLLEKQYKDRKILRKKGDYKHKVDTVIRLPPADLATIDAMSRLDMPFPAHFANVQSWNPLNIHGWIDLYQVTDQKRINNNLYEAKLHWEYLTRELYSLMTILRDKEKVCNITNVTDSFDTVFYPEYPILDFFNFSGNGVILDTYKEYEMNDDGMGDYKDTQTLEFAEIMVETPNQVFLTSKYTLPNKCRVTLNWKDYLPVYSNDILEDFTRIIRLVKIDEDTQIKDTVFEYVYTDFTHYDFSNEYVVNTIINESKVDAIASVNDEWVNVASNNIVLDYDEDYVTSDPDGQKYVDDDGELNYTVGSSFVLTLNGKKLSILDEGHSGTELDLDDVTLESGDYYLEVEMTNQSNLDDEEYTWQSLLNVKVETDDNDYIYSKVYDDTIVSPSPLENMPLSFTRLGEDGILYYYKYNSNKSYKYRGDPYNPYATACNIETSDGVSMFDCNNDYDPVCLQNGLIKVALYRYSGYVQFYKYKWKPYGEGEWLPTYQFVNRTKNKKMSVEEYSTDRISIKWGLTTWTIWRGRPFVSIKHPNTSFKIVTTTETVYCDLANGRLGAYDVYHNRNLFGDLGNNRLLEEGMVSVSAKDIKSKTPRLTVDLYTDDTLLQPPYTIKADDRLKIKTQLTYNGAVLPNKTIFLLSDMGDGFAKDGVQLLTNNNGEVVFTRGYEATGNVSYKVVFYGNNDYNPFESDEYNVEIIKPRKATNLSASFLVGSKDKSEVQLNSVVNVNGVLRTDPLFLWNKQTITLNGGVSSENIKIISETANTGDYIESVTCYYAVSENDIEPTGGYDTDYNNVKGQLSTDIPYLWHYKEIVFNNGDMDTTEEEIIFQFTDTAISSIDEKYALSDYSDETPSQYKSISVVTADRVCENVPIQLYLDNVLLETHTTDNKGEFTFSTTLEEIGTHRLLVISEKTDELQSDTKDHSYWVKYPSTFTISPTEIYEYVKTPLIGKVEYENPDTNEKEPLVNWRVYVKYNEEIVDFLRTDENGYFTYYTPEWAEGTYDLEFVVKSATAISTVLGVNTVVPINVTHADPFPYTISLSCDVSETFVYDSFDIWGNVKDQYGDPISEGLVDIVVNGEPLSYSTSVNSEGNYRVGVAMQTIGINTITTVCGTASSPTVRVNATKQPTSITMTGESTVIIGEEKYFNGDCDGVGVIGNPVFLLKDDVEIDETITGEYGLFTFPIPSDELGTHTYQAYFKETDTNLPSFSEPITVTVIPEPPVVSSVNLSSDKVILSFKDSDTTILSATVLDSNDEPMSGMEVTFYQKLPSQTPTVMGTAITAYNGVATLSYSAMGVGELTFTAEAEDMLSNNVEITDYIVYDDLTVDKNRYTLTQGEGNFSFDDTGLTVLGTVNSDTFWYSPDDLLPADDYTVEVDYIDWSSSGFGSDFGIEDIFIGILPSSNELTVYKKNGSALTVLRNFDFVKGKTFKFEVTGTTSKTIAIYYDNNLIYTASNITQTRKQFFKTYKDRLTVFKNLKIRA